MYHATAQMTLLTDRFFSRPSRQAMRVAMPAEKSPSTTASADTPAEHAPALTVNGLVVTSVPGMLTSLALGEVDRLEGLPKIGVGAALAVLLWWIAKGRKRHGGQLRRGLEQYWRWALLALASVAVLSLVGTNLRFGVPTPLTIIVCSIVLGVLVSLAYLGRRLGPVAAATGSGVAGASIGLCLSIAF